MSKFLNYPGFNHALGENTQALANYTTELASTAASSLQRGTAQKYGRFLAIGMNPSDAAEQALRTGKGFIGEALAVADYNKQARLLGSDVHARLNPISNDPVHDIQFIHGQRIVGGVQVKFGTSRYVKQALLSGKYPCIVANTEAVQELRDVYDHGLLTNRIDFNGIQGSPLSEQEAYQIGREILWKLNHPHNHFDLIARWLGNEIYLAAHNVFYSTLFGFSLHSLISFLSVDRDKMNWDEIVMATQKIAQSSLIHYGVCRSVSLSLEMVAANCAGSVFGRAAQFLLKKGAWISAGVSAGLAIWDAYGDYKEGKISQREFYGHTGRSSGGAIGAVGGGYLGARIGSCFGPVGTLIGLLAGSLLLSNVGAHVGEDIGHFVHDFIHPDSLPPYLLHQVS